MNIFTIKLIPFYFIISIIMYVFAIYFNATYYLPSGYVEWDNRIDWVKQIALISHVTLNQIREVFPPLLLILIGIVYTLLIALISVPNKKRKYKVLFFILILILLPFVSLGLLSLYTIIIDGGFDGEWLAESWTLMHAYGILFFFIIFITFLSYKKKGYA